MKSKLFVWLGLLLAGIYWIAESAIHVLVFHQGTFVQNLVSDNTHEIWMRSFIVTLFVSFGGMAQLLNDKKVRGEIRRGDEQFKRLVDSSPEAIAVHREGRLIYVNTAFAQLLGVAEPDELIGRSELSLIHPDDREEVAKRICQIFENGASSYRVERKLLRLNGEAFLAEISAIPVEFDGVPSVMVLARDINERKRWEIALQASVEKAETAQKREREQALLLERFYQHTHDCIVLLDKNFNFIRVNQAYADSCKRGVDEFLGHNHFDFYPSSLIEDFKQVVASGIAYRAFTRPFSFPDHPEWGETYWDLSLVPIFNASGEIDLLLFTLKDVTAGHRAELALRKTNRELSTISACDSLLVHASDEAELLNGMCRMIVEKNGYCMA